MKNIRMVLLLIIFSSIFIWTYSGGIKWGTPNLKRSRQIFKNEEELRKFVPQMVKMREEFYKKRSELYSDKGEIDKSQIKTKMDEVFWEHTGKVKVMDIIPRETILNAIRSYFISTNLSDEGQALFPLTSMNPGKLDFDPKFYVYGGLYYYFVGISLAIGKILGFISLTHDIQHYFLNPEETANIYTIIRTINILAILIGAIIVFKIARQIFKHRITATLCLFLFLISPILFLQTHLSKPHAIAMLFLATGLLLIYQSFQTGNIKYEIAAAISFGLSAALLVINLFFVIFFITADIVRRKKLSFITYLCFFLAFAIPN
ncbi:MAG: glycosyltransferase family 39 protein, partial [Elusimicrobiota bacterium]